MLSLIKNIHLWMKFIKINQKISYNSTRCTKKTNDRKIITSYSIDQVQTRFLVNITNRMIDILFLISQVIIPPMHWNSIHRTWFNHYEFYKGREFRGRRNKNRPRPAPGVIAWPGTKGWSRRWKIHGGMGKTGAFPIPWLRYGTTPLLYARLCNEMSPVLEQSRCSFVLLSFSRVGNASLLTRQDVDPNYVCTRIVSPEYTCVRRHPGICGSKSSSEHEYSTPLSLNREMFTRAL